VKNKSNSRGTNEFFDKVHVYQDKFDYEELHTFLQRLCNRINYQIEVRKNFNTISRKRKKSPFPATKQEIRDFYWIDHILMEVHTSNTLLLNFILYSVLLGYIGKTVHS